MATKKVQKDVITVRKSARSENIVFIGWESDDLGFLTQVVDWKVYEKGAAAGLKAIKDAKVQGYFNNGQFEFVPDGLELQIEGI